MENQTTEWKESWQDEYLKWICGFANAQGGELHIGKNDSGEVVGINTARELLEKLPLKIRNTMGVVADVNLTDDGKCIVIKVNAYPHPISYHGKYYLRSGSTTQELTGNALDEFMLRTQGKTWDGVPVPYVTVPDLDIVAFREFRKKALSRDRLTEQDLYITDEQLIESLKLKDGNYLKRAAVLLFHEDPEKWVTGAYVKIGYFKTDADLIYQDEIHGPLITMPDKVLDMIYDKYYRGIISYKGIQRFEKFPVAKEALREAILNAIQHKDYARGVPIQIKVYDDKTIIFNTGKLPTDWTADKLLSTHGSEPYNPDIANVFFRSGMTEAWGRGIEKIINESKKSGKPTPIFEPAISDFTVTFYTDDSIGINIGINETQNKILELMIDEPSITAKQIAENIGIAKRNVETNIKALKETGILKRVGANKNGYWTVNRH